MRVSTGRGEEVPREEAVIKSMIEWQLHQVAAGAEVVLIDADRHPVARGIVSRDRRTLFGPNGESIVVGSVRAVGIRLVQRAKAMAV